MPTHIRIDHELSTCQLLIAAEEPTSSNARKVERKRTHVRVYLGNAAAKLRGTYTARLISIPNQPSPSIQATLERAQ